MPIRTGQSSKVFVLTVEFCIDSDVFLDVIICIMRICHMVSVRGIKVSRLVTNY